MRRKRSSNNDVWHLDEVVITISGKKHWLWRAVDQDGGDCYSYGLLASGHVDVVFGASLEPYDFLPLGALVESAGGIMTDWSGNRPGPQDTNACVVASATPALHAEILALLRAARPDQI